VTPHDLYKLLEFRLEKTPEVPVSYELRCNHGLESEELFEEWCRDVGFAVQPPLIAGLSHMKPGTSAQNGEKVKVAAAIPESVPFDYHLVFPDGPEFRLDFVNNGTDPIALRSFQLGTEVLWRSADGVHRRIASGSTAISPPPPVVYPQEPDTTATPEPATAGTAIAALGACWLYRRKARY
jgi:hypothetical protein